MLFPSPTGSEARATRKRGRERFAQAERNESALARQLNSTRLGRKPASVLPPPVGAISKTERPACALAKSSNWCARGVQPRLANQRANGSGRIAVRSRMVTRQN